MHHDRTVRGARRLPPLIALVMIWNLPMFELHAQQARLSMTIIPLEEENRGQPERDVTVQIQDISRGPIPGVTVTFTAPGGRNGGVFSNGVRTITVKTDKDGIANAPGFRPSDPDARVRIDVEATYEGQRVTATMLSGGISRPGGSKIKWVYILAGGGAAAVLGALLTGRKNTGTSTTPPVITITPGSPNVGAP